MADVIEGGCNCGDIRYRISSAPFAVAACHCINCRKQSGSAFSVNLVVPSAAVEMQGNLTVYDDPDTESGKPVRREFCGRCGSPIRSVTSGGNGIEIIKAGTTDTPDAFAPGIQVWTCTSLPWVKMPEGIPSFERNPPG